MPLRFLKALRLPLFGELDFDESVFDFDVLDSTREGVVFHSAGEGSEEVFTLEFTKPGVGDGNAVDGEIVEDESGIDFMGFDKEASAGFYGLSSEYGEILSQGGVHAGMECAPGQFNFELFSEIGVIIDETIDLAFCENEGVDAGLVLGCFDSQFNGVFFRGGENDWGILLTYIPPRSTGGEADGEENKGCDENRAQKIALRENGRAGHSF